MHLDRAFEFSGDGGGIQRRQRADAGGRQVPRDTPDAQAVPPVGSDLDLDDGIGKPHDVHRPGAEGGVFGQFDDDVVVVAEAHFLCGQQHAVGNDTPDFRRLQGYPGSRNMGPRGRENANQPGPGVGRAANDLDGFGAVVHPADRELVRVRVLFRFDNPADDKILQAPGAVMDPIDFEADHGQPLDHVIQGGFRIQMFLEPTKGELHGL